MQSCYKQEGHDNHIHVLTFFTQSVTKKMFKQECRVNHEKVLSGQSNRETWLPKGQMIETLHNFSSHHQSFIIHPWENSNIISTYCLPKVSSPISTKIDATHKRTQQQTPLLCLVSQSLSSLILSFPNSYPLMDKFQTLCLLKSSELIKFSFPCRTVSLTSKSTSGSR